MMAPPAFSVAAGSLNPGGETPLDEAHNALVNAGLCRGEVEMLEHDHVHELHKVSKKYPGKEWTHVHRILTRHRMDHGLDPVMNSILGDGEWVMDRDVESLGNIRECRYRNSEGEDLQGHMELVKKGNDPGVRATVPYGKTKGAYGPDLILSKSKTTTYLGRLIDEAAAGGDLQVAVDAEAGTNYLRFQQNTKVGKNTGGSNVLSIRDWSLEKNVEWLKAAIRRGDVIEFVSDPFDLGNIFRGGDVNQRLTVTGIELGILLSEGYGPQKNSRLVVPILEIEGGPLSVWKTVLKKANEEMAQMSVDGEDHQDRFENNAASPDRMPLVRENKTTSKVAMQTNFFGGTPNRA